MRLLSLWSLKRGLCSKVSRHHRCLRWQSFYPKAWSLCISLHYHELWPSIEPVWEQCHLRQSQEQSCSTILTPRFRTFCAVLQWKDYPSTPRSASVHRFLGTSSSFLRILITTFRSALFRFRSFSSSSLARYAYSKTYPFDLPGPLWLLEFPLGVVHCLFRDVPARLACFKWSGAWPLSRSSVLRKVFRVRHFAWSNHLPWQARPSLW